MSKKMLINATLPEEDRVAIVDDGILTELDIEIAGRQQTKSNIYKGEVVRVEQGLQAAFIDYGASRPGFLQIGEIHPSLYPKQEDGTPPGRRPPINQILKRGQQLLVQVVKEERGTKGAALTTEISLPGRYMVLMPESDSRGISRKIENESVRKQIKQAMSGLELPDNMGYIIRTAAIDQPPEELKRDFDYLLSTYNSIVAHGEKTKAPALIYQESNLVLRSIRDYFSPEIDEVLIDDRKVYQEAREFFKAVMPEYTALVKLHQERRPIFARYQIEEQIAQLSSNTVPLPSGGSIVLDQTEALVAIDVNSGKTASEHNVEDTAFRVNIEAASEVARQLRLRDMGGLIVIDFIDMRQRKNAREVEKTLKNALKIDKARVTVGRISHQFGLLEMSRQRIKGNLGEGSYNLCPQCQGTGRIRSAEARSIALLRSIQAGTAKGSISTVNSSAPVDVVNYMLNNKRRELLDLEQRYNLTISIKADNQFLPEQTELEFVKQTKEQNNGNNRAPLVDTTLSDRNQQQEESAPENEGEEQPSTPDSNSETEGTTNGAKDAEPSARKRPRRRRRPRRTKDQANGQSAVAQAEASPAPEEVSPQSEAAHAPATEQVSAKNTDESQHTDLSTAANEKAATSEEVKAVAPARESAESETKKRPTRRKSAAKTTKTESSEQSDTSADSVEKTAPEETATEVKKPVRRRRATGKKVADTTKKEDTPSQDATKAPEEEKPKRRTPRRKSSVTTSDSAATTEADKTDSTAGTPEEAAAQPEPKKPVRRRRTTKKATSAAAAENKETQTEQQAAEIVQLEKDTTTGKAAEDSDKKKPARRRTTTRKTSSTKKVATEKEVAAAQETAANKEAANNESAVKKKPTSRRRTTKKETAEPAVGTGSEADSSATDTSAETPKKRTTTRKTTTKKTSAKSTAASADGTATTSAEDGSDAIAEKKPVRRRTTRKKTTEEETASEKKTPTRRSSTKKQALKKDDATEDK